ncbi:uncharacterized protein LOC131219893 [Magnolia sinica]|uniref:uncharacterized protein LOC131219893 n=1 Tax=Magnolia sinica TaxID=86752 RepID=UPI002659E74F|nr:uncharacterized protein LOC131219893 [Magnolia sinica]
MNEGRANSSPELPSPSNPDDSTLEGVAASVKLLLKLVQEHNDAAASNKDIDGRKTQRVASMIGVLDDIRSRIEKSQPSGRKLKREAELRRCNTDLRRTQNPQKERKLQEPIHEENQRLRKELSTNLAARKSLERMFSSLGKEKEIMATELARKAQELNGMEEHINDLKAQNEMLLAKVKCCASEHKEKKINGGGDLHGNVALQERNKALSDQLLKSLEGYRSLKWKLKDSQEENAGIRAKLVEIRKEALVGLDRIHDLRQRVAERDDPTVDIEEELSAVESMFKCFEAKVVIGGPKRSEGTKAKAADVVAEKSPVLA